MNTTNLNNIVSTKESGWKAKAIWRKANKAWLDRSGKIAIRILREIRIQKKTNNMSQKKLAKLMDVSPQYINKIVKGQENLTLETITKIEKVLGINLINVQTYNTAHSVIKFEIKTSPVIEKGRTVTLAKRKFSYKTGYLQESTGTYGRN